MCIQIPHVSEAQIAELVSKIDSDGFATIPDYVSQSDLLRMQAFTDAAIQRSGGEYVHFDGPDAVTGSGLEELAHSERFKALVHRIYEVGTGRRGPNQEFYQVLRCLAGKGAMKNSYIFHYDSYVVTALLPIRIPESGMSGDLVMRPNTRKVRGTYLRNAVDKVLLDNPVTQTVLRKGLTANYLPFVRIKMKPGNLYFFWGYRSVHTNEPCDPDKTRATALFHYANPHRTN